MSPVTVRIFRLQFNVHRMQRVIYMFNQQRDHFIITRDHERSGGQVLKVCNRKDDTEIR